MLKKPYVVRERIPEDIDGVYCIFPFDILEADGSGVFKIGMTTHLDRRLQNYHTYLPKGYYKKCLLKNIPLPAHGKYSNNRAAYYKMIEKEIFNHVKNLGGEAIHIQNRKAKGGETEWIYVKERKILEAFDAAYHKYGGNLDYWDLSAPLKRKLKKLREDSIFEGRIFFDD